MTQFAVEEAIMLRLRVEENKASEKVDEEEALHDRLLEIAHRQGKG